MPASQAGRRVPVHAFEGLVVVCCTVTALLLASWPYIEAWRTPAEDMVFTGLLDGHSDYSTYLVKIEAGRQGRLLYRNPYDPSGGERLPLHLFWIALGWIARWTGATSIVAFHGARVIFGGAFLLVAYRLLRAVFGAPRISLLSFLLLTSSSGLTGVIVHLPMFHGDRLLRFTDALVPEGNTFFSLMLNPGFLFSMAMIAIAVRDVLTVVRGGHGGWMGGVAALLLGVVHPMSLGALWVVLGAFVAVELLAGSLSLRKAGALALRFGGLSAIPPVAYACLWRHSPEVKNWVAQNLCLSPPPAFYVAGYGLLSVLAIVGVVSCVREPRPATRLVVVWLLVGFALLYAPVSVQRRLCEGYHIPVVLGAGMALRRGRRTALWPLVLLLSLGTTHLLVRGFTNRARHPSYPSYVEKDVLRATDWLSVAHAGALVLCEPTSAWVVTRYAHGRVVAGHWAETPAYAQRTAQVRSFLAGSMPPSRRVEWLDQTGVRLLIWTPREAARSGVERPPGGWSEVWRKGDVAVWERNGDGGAGAPTTSNRRSQIENRQWHHSTPQHSNTPSLQYPTTPTLHYSNTPRREILAEWG